MNWNQILITGLLTLDELGFLTFNEPDPDNCKVGTQVIWQSALSDFTEIELKAAFEWASQNWTNKFNQKISPGDLRGFVNKNTSLNHGEMFKEIMDKCHAATSATVKPGTQIMEKYQFAPLVQEAIKQMGGIDSFKHLLIENESTFRAQFRDVVNALNEKDQNKHFVKPILDARQALAESNKPQVKAIEAPKAELETFEPDPRVVESFAALRAKFEKRKMEAQTAKGQAMKTAVNNMAQALEAFK
mgnify:CR=1 FL=1